MDLQLSLSVVITGLSRVSEVRVSWIWLRISGGKSMKPFLGTVATWLVAIVIVQRWQMDQMCVVFMELCVV